MNLSSELKEERTKCAELEEELESFKEDFVDTVAEYEEKLKEVQDERNKKNRLIFLLVFLCL